MIPDASFQSYGRGSTAEELPLGNICSVADLGDAVPAVQSVVPGDHPDRLIAAARRFDFSTEYNY